MTDFVFKDRCRDSDIFKFPSNNLLFISSAKKLDYRVIGIALSLLAPNSPELTIFSGENRYDFCKNSVPISKKSCLFTAKKSQI